MEELKAAVTNGGANLQFLDPSTLPQIHSGLSANSGPGDKDSAPKILVPPSYEEALASSRQISIEDTYISAVYAPPYPPPYTCDHHPSRECPFCSTPARSSANSRRRCRPTRHLTRRGASCPRVLLFSLVFMFFLILTSVLYNIILVEPFFYPASCDPLSNTTTPLPPK